MKKELQMSGACQEFCGLGLAFLLFDERARLECVSKNGIDLVVMYFRGK